MRSLANPNRYEPRLAFVWWPRRLFNSAGEYIGWCWWEYVRLVRVGCYDPWWRATLLDEES
jgi:hypothetical protein